MSTLSEEFLFRFVINLIFNLVLSYLCYFRNSKNRQIAASLVLFGVGIFIITNLLHRVDISMGFAFGLFAIFTMLRYRTEPISIKEMTYLFVMIAIALLTAVSNATLIEIIFINTLLCFVAFALDSKLTQGKYLQQSVQYEKIENIRPDREAFLVADLSARTGLNVHRVVVEHIDFLRDTALLKVEYLPEPRSKSSFAAMPSKNEKVIS